MTLTSFRLTISEYCQGNGHWHSLILPVFLFFFIYLCAIRFL